MAYNNIITRGDARALETPKQLISEVIKGVTQGSTILPLMRRLPNMTGKDATMAVLSSLPEAYWVNGDTGLKQTTSAMWKNKRLTAEEIAVVVPISINVLNDSDYDIWAEIRPQIIEQFYKKIDEAIILGRDKPTSWREGLIPSIINSGNTITPADANTYTQISDAMSKVEEDGFDVNGILGGVALKGEFRKGLLDTTGQPLANSDVTELPRMYARNGAWDNTLAKFIVGDFSQAVYAIREDIDFKIFESGVVTDNNGNIIYNLMQQDMVALRVTMRMAWELPNPINALNSDEATRFPFALVETEVAPETHKITFTVNDNEGTAVADAKVTYAGQTKKTASDGTVSFETLGDTSGLYKVAKKAYQTIFGEVAINKADVDKAVVVNIKAE